MKKFMKLEKNRVFILLSFFFIVSLLILVRDNDYPLIWKNKIFIFLFVPKRSEKILFSISVSYIAAYWFYLLQIYIPCTLKNKNALNFLKGSLVKEIEILKYLLFIIDQTIQVDNNTYTVKKISSKKIYIVVEKELSQAKYLRRYTFSHGESSTCGQILKLAKNTMEQIYNNYFFHDLDSYIASRLYKIDIEEFFCFFEQINNAYDDDERQYTINRSSIINEVHTLINEMEKAVPSLSTVRFHICNQNHYCEKYDQQWLSYKDEFKLTINIP